MAGLSFLLGREIFCSVSTTRRSQKRVYRSDRPNLPSRVGNLQAGLAQHSEAVDSYERAIAAYDRALTLAPDDIYALNNQGLALNNLGDLYDELSEEKAAIKCWQAALDSFSHSLKIAPSDRYIQNLRDELLAFLNDNP